MNTKSGESCRPVVNTWGRDEEDEDKDDNVKLALAFVSGDVWMYIAVP